MSKKKMTAAERKTVKTRRRLLIAVGILSAVLCLLIALALYLRSTKAPGVPDAPNATETTAVSDETAMSIQQQVEETAQTTPAQSESEESLRPISNTLGYDVELLDMGKYTGMFMEDGSDEIVSNVLMLKIINNGEEAIQYAEITMSYGGETAKFTVSTLLPGATMILLEQNRMEYSADAPCGNLEMKNVALFNEPLSLCEDKLEIQILDGAINVTNISGEDISGEVRIFYKNYADGIYYGGITYVVRIQDGIPADGVKQIMASHFSDTGSVIMFVTCG